MSAPAAAVPLRVADLYIARDPEHEGRVAVFQHVDGAPHVLVAGDFQDRREAERWIAYQAAERGQREEDFFAAAGLPCLPPHLRDTPAALRPLVMQEGDLT